MCWWQPTSRTPSDHRSPLGAGLGAARGGAWGSKERLGGALSCPSCSLIKLFLDSASRLVTWFSLRQSPPCCRPTRPSGLVGAHWGSCFQRASPRQPYAAEEAEEAVCLPGSGWARGRARSRNSGTRSPGDDGLIPLGGGRLTICPPGSLAFPSESADGRFSFPQCLPNCVARGSPGGPSGAR